MQKILILCWNTYPVTLVAYSATMLLQLNVNTASILSIPKSRLISIYNPQYLYKTRCLSYTIPIPISISVDRNDFPKPYHPWFFASIKCIASSRMPLASALLAIGLSLCSLATPAALLSHAIALVNFSNVPCSGKRSHSSLFRPFKHAIALINFSNVPCTETLILSLAYTLLRSALLISLTSQPFERSLTYTALSGSSVLFKPLSLCRLSPVA